MACLSSVQSPAVTYSRFKKKCLKKDGVYNASNRITILHFQQHCKTEYQETVSILLLPFFSLSFILQRSVTGSWVGNRNLTRVMIGEVVIMMVYCIGVIKENN